MWKNKLRIGKTLSIDIDVSNDGSRDIYLPTYTKGVNWNDTIGIIGHPLIDTTSDIGSIKCYLVKKNDNSFTAECEILKSKPVVNSYVLFDSNGLITDSFSSGIKIDISSPLVFTFQQKGFQKGDFSRLNIEIYLDDKLIDTVYNLNYAFGRTGRIYGWGSRVYYLPYGEHILKLKKVGENDGGIENIMCILQKSYIHSSNTEKVNLLFSEYTI